MTSSKNKPKPMTKTELKNILAEKTGLNGKQTLSVLDALNEVVLSQVGTVGVFTFPGLCKIVRSHKPATAAKKMISPMTKEEIMVKAKPARNVVKVRALKALKDSV